MEANNPASGLFAVDHSSLAMYKECPRKYFYGIVQGYRAKSLAPPLSFGSAYHAGLETFERAVAAGATRHGALRLAIRAAIAHELPADPVRTRTTLIRALVWHEEHYRNDQIKTLTLPNGKPAVELSFRVELPFSFSHSPDSAVIYCGHIDKLVEYQSRVFAMEHKHTVSALTNHYWQRYVFSSQISGYVLATEANFNIEVGGAIIDATQVGVTFARFGRRVAARVKAHQEEWLLDLHYWLTQLDASFATDRWPHNHESCSKYRGCQFRSVCFSNPSVRDVVLRDEFRIEKWDPLRTRGDE